MQTGVYCGHLRTCLWWRRHRCLPSQHGGTNPLMSVSSNVPLPFRMVIQAYVEHIVCLPATTSAIRALWSPLEWIYDSYLGAQNTWCICANRIMKECDAIFPERPSLIITEMMYYFSIWFKNMVRSINQAWFTFICSKIFAMDNGSTMIILCMRLANEKWRYTVIPSLIGSAHTHNNHWKYQHSKCHTILRDFDNHFGLGRQFVEVSRNHQNQSNLQEAMSLAWTLFLVMV